MRSRLAVRLVVAFAAFTFAGAAYLRAAVPNRIKGAVTDAGAVALPGNVHPQMKRAVDRGLLDGATQLTGLSLNFAPSAAQQAALDALLLAQQNPSSPSYHQWLTPEQFGEQFGMSADDLAKVTTWLQSRGFTVERVAPSRNAIHFSGTAEQVDRAFHTELHSLTVDGEIHFANSTEPMLPAAFAGTVAGVRGLNDFRPQPHVRPSVDLVPYAVGSRKVGAAASVTPFAVDPTTGSNYVAPSDFAKIYNVTSLYNAGFNGSASYPIAVVGQSAVYTSDLTAFKSAFGLTATLPTMVLMPGTGNSAVITTDDLSESELDLEWSSAVAPGAPVYFIYTGNAGCSSNVGCSYGVFDALQYAIQSYTVGGKPVPIVSVSYGECEPSDTPANLASYEGWFKQANAQGQTVLSASGDQGAAGCDYTTTSANNYAATKGLAVDYPSSSQYVTGVGGASFSGDLTSKSTYWGTTNDANYGNELGLYIPSSTWNNTPTSSTAIAAKGLSASGGGVSALWPKPAWQKGTGVPADGKRDVPDIALAADPSHDGFLVCINSSCAQGYFNVYGGTSVAAPSFAGILALTEQKLAASQGNLNPMIYALAANSSLYASVFHDITTGSNIVPCIVAATDTGCSGGSMGYSATAGYDLVTGLGAPDANNFATALSGVTPLINTTETLTYTPSSPVTGQTVTFTATVSHATGTIVPSGTVVFTVDGATTGTTATLSPTGIALFTTSFTTGGSHTVSAVYSGDANYYGSTATATVNITAPATGVATTTSLTATPSTVALGSTLTLVATVASTTTGSPSGSVTFKTSNGSTLGPVNLTSAGGNTATATLALPVTSAAFVIGSNTVSATYAGSTTYAPSASTASATVTVTNPVITLTATPISIASGAAGSSTLTVVSSGGYQGTVVFSASTTSTVLANYSSIRFTPVSLALNSGQSGTATFTISTNSAVPALQGAGTLQNTLALVTATGGLSFAALWLFGLGRPSRRRWPNLLCGLIALAALGAAVGCGSSSTTGGGGGGGTTTGTNVPAGTYAVTLIGTDSVNSAVRATVSITLTLK